MPVEHDPAGGLRHQTHDRFHGGGLAGTIATHECHDFAAADVEPDIVKDLRGAIGGAQSIYREHRRAHALTSALKVLPVPK